MKVPYDQFLQEVWGWQCDAALNEEGKKFIVACQHILSSFHWVQRSTAVDMMNHERSFFCEVILPGLLALSKMLGFVEFKWCEAKYKATKTIYQKMAIMMAVQLRQQKEYRCFGNSEESQSNGNGSCGVFERNARRTHNPYVGGCTQNSGM